MVMEITLLSFKDIQITTLLPVFRQLKYLHTTATPLAQILGADNLDCGILFHADITGKKQLKFPYLIQDNNNGNCCCELYLSMPMIPCFFTHKFGIRPVLKFTPTEFEQLINKAKNSNCIVSDDSQSFMPYGTYPQEVISPKENPELIGQLNNYHRFNIRQTRKTYTFNQKSSDTYHPQTYNTYEANGNHFIRIETRKTQKNLNLIEGEMNWVQIQPIMWLIDKDNHQLIAQNSLLGGIPLTTKETYNGEFHQTHLFRYLNTVFANEMMLEHTPLPPKNELTEFKESLVATFSQHIETIYQDNRFQFFHDVLIYTRDYAENIPLSNEMKQAVLFYGKEIVVKMSQNSKITPTQKIQQIQSELNNKSVFIRRFRQQKEWERTE